MAAEPLLGYAQARLQARHGERPGPGFWQQLAATRDATQYLRLARTGALRHWTRGLGPEAGIHEVERAFRHAWRAYVAEIATWQPAAWRPALRFLDTLPDLEFAEHVAGGAPAADWFGADPRLRELQASGAPGAGWSAELLAARTGRSDMGGAWRARWRARWPAGAEPAIAESLERLAEQVAAHFQQPARAASAPGASALRAELARVLTRCFRREARSIAAAVAHLGLVAIDAERLRWGLLRRIAFRGVPEATAWA